MTPREYSIRVDVHDPWIDRAEAQHEYGLHCLAELPRVAPPLPSPAPPGGRGQDDAPGEDENTGPYDALILAVAHREFIAMGAAGLRALGKPKSVLYDVKVIYENNDTVICSQDLRLTRWLPAHDDL